MDDHQIEQPIEYRGSAAVGNLFVVRINHSISDAAAETIEVFLEKRLEAKLGRRVPVLALGPNTEQVVDHPSVLESIDNRLSDIEAKLDFLMEALSADQDEEEKLTLDGEPAGEERDQTQSLG